MDAFLQQQPRRVFEAQTITPLTCHQVLTAEPMQGDNWKANGRPLGQVTVVGILRDFKQEGNSIKARIQDAMGYEIEVQKWGTDVGEELADNQALPAELRKHLIRATGHVRNHKGEKVVMASKVALVQHFEEFMSHMLHSSYTLNYHKHGPLPKPPPKTPGAVGAASPPQASPLQASPQAASPVAAAPAPVAPPALAAAAATPGVPGDAAKAMERAVLNLCAGHEVGMHKDAVVKEVVQATKGATPAAVRAVIDQMINVGNLFTTKDQFHISA